MPTMIRKEKRKLGIFGIVFRILFYAFNLCMLVWVSLFWYSASDAAGHLPSSPAHGFGLLFGTGMLCIARLIGDAILGVPVLITKGTKIIIDGVPAAKKVRIASN